MGGNWRIKYQNSPRRTLAPFDRLTAPGCLVNVPAERPHPGDAAIWRLREVKAPPVARYYCGFTPPGARSVSLAAPTAPLCREEAGLRSIAVSWRTLWSRSRRHSATTSRTTPGHLAAFGPDHAEDRLHGFPRFPHRAGAGSSAAGCGYRGWPAARCGARPPGAGHEFTGAHRSLPHCANVQPISLGDPVTGKRSQDCRGGRQCAGGALGITGRDPGRPPPLSIRMPMAATTASTTS